MIDLQSEIRIYLKKFCYRISFMQLIQEFQNGIFKLESKRIMNCRLFEYHQKLNPPKPFEKWKIERLENLKLGYGIAKEIEIEIQNYIFENIIINIVKMEDLKVIFSFEDGLMVQSVLYNPAYPMGDMSIMDFRHLYPSVICDPETVKKFRIKENNINMGYSNP